MLFNKKGSLEISIQAIVIVVLAMTLLGLGLAFIKIQIGKMGETAGQVQDQIKQQILEDLRTGDKKLSFPSSRITVASGDKVDLAIGIKNTNDYPARFRVDLYKRNDEGTFLLLEPTTREPGSFFWDNSEQDLSLGSDRVFGIVHQAETTKDTYLYKVVITEIALGDDQQPLTDEETGEPVESEYDSKSFFITVA